MRNHWLLLGALLVGWSVFFSGRILAEENQADKVSKELQKLRDMIDNLCPMTWVFVGDSLTQEGQNLEGWRTYSQHFAERLRFELHRNQDVVIPMGVSAARIDRLLRDFYWRVKRLDPNVVFIMIGTGDAGNGTAGQEAFRKNLGELIDQIRTCGAIPLLQTPNTAYPGIHPNDLAAYVEIIREVAREKDIPLVDHYKHWQETQPKQDDLLKWLADKQVYPNIYGHREIAKELFRALNIYNTNSPTCNLPVP